MWTFPVFELEILNAGFNCNFDMTLTHGVSFSASLAFGDEKSRKISWSNKKKCLSLILNLIWKCWKVLKEIWKLVLHFCQLSWWHSCLCLFYLTTNKELRYNELLNNWFLISTPIFSNLQISDLRTEIEKLQLHKNLRSFSEVTYSANRNL